MKKMENLNKDKTFIQLKKEIKLNIIDSLHELDSYLVMEYKIIKNNPRFDLEKWNNYSEGYTINAFTEKEAQHLINQAQQIIIKNLNL